MKMQPVTFRTLRHASVHLVGAAAALWSLAGVAATDVATVTAASTAAAPSKTIIIVGGRSALRSALNPQPLPPRW